MELNQNMKDGTVPIESQEGLQSKSLIECVELDKEKSLEVNESDQKLTYSGEVETGTTSISDKIPVSNKDLNNVDTVSDLGDSRIIEGTEKSVKLGANSDDLMNKFDVNNALVNNCVEETSNYNLKDLTNKLSELQNICEKMPESTVKKDEGICTNISTESSIHCEKEIAELEPDNIAVSSSLEIEDVSNKKIVDVEKYMEAEPILEEKRIDDKSEELEKIETNDRTFDVVQDVSDDLPIPRDNQDDSEDKSKEKVEETVHTLEKNMSIESIIIIDELETKGVTVSSLADVEANLQKCTALDSEESPIKASKDVTKDKIIELSKSDSQDVSLILKEKPMILEIKPSESKTGDVETRSADINELKKSDLLETKKNTLIDRSKLPIVILEDPTENLFKEIANAESPQSHVSAKESYIFSKMSSVSKDSSTVSKNSTSTVPEKSVETRVGFNEADDRSMEENPIFVHVSSKNEKGNASTETEPVDDVMEVETLAEEDPIGVYQVQLEKDDAIDFDTEESNLDDKEPMKVVGNNVIEDLVSGKGADEELCIIPDTDREISQEEKDAATAAAAAATTNDANAPTKCSPAKVPLKSPTKTIEIEDDKTNESSKNSIEEIEINSSEDDTRLHGTISVVNHVRQLNNQTDDLKVITLPEAEAVEQLCQQCNNPRKCTLKLDFQGKDVFLCRDTCMISFRTLNKPKSTVAKNSEIPIKLKDMSKDMAISTDTECNKTFVRKCSECNSGITKNDEKVLSWETMEYCNEECLAKYQNKIGSHCANCNKTVVMSSLGKYCVRFGHDIRQFCCSICLEEFKKGLKVCSYCQKDISGGAEGFLAPVGDKGQFKDFCSQLCMENFDLMSNKNSNRVSVLEIGVCSVCMNEKQLAITFEQMSNKQKFCSEPCFVAFKFVNNVDPLLCDMCKKYFETKNSAEFSIYSDMGIKNFCCKTCQNIHIIANRRIVPCSWCKVKKYNFDMIKKICATGQILNMCSLNCLSLFQVSVNAVNAKKLKCDFCQKGIQTQYHLTMSDATLRNFCSYTCVISFQNQFPTLPITYGPERAAQTVAAPQPAPIPACPTRRNYQANTRSLRSSDQNKSVSEMQLPVITSVQSLANQNSTPTGRSTLERTSQSSASQTVIPPASQIKHQVIIKAPPRPQMKNKATIVKPITKTKAVSCSVMVSNKQTQTDEQKEKVRIVPIPVPIYIPAPMHMFSRPMPVPVPFPLPIPVPIFIPTTRNSAAGIMKEIKKIQVKIPTDPFEAELLMMAEMVAGEKKIEHTDSESDDDDHGGSAADGSFSPEAVDTSNTFGEDMLQMALKMATELDEPAVDLEGALTASTITATQSTESTGTPEESIDDPQPIHPHHQLMDRGQAIRGRKRTVRQARGGAIIPTKRGRRMSTNVDIPMLPPPQPSQPPEPVEKPDANMCLKYTFGVNAWKQWVTTKNAELEKSSRRIKLFKNEILQLTADELNYSLCLFVKEVRKPNGTEYAPDTIYYLCLGIQQYLFENGRIDNIFTDAYYEKFTDCLDEVAKKFSVLYNDSHYIVTRVEEEHLWESKQLGAHSPHVLLSTLMFFNTKHFNLTTVDEHMQLSFSHIMKHWKRNPNQPGAAKVPGSRNVLLRFYPPQTTLDTNSRKKKVYEQQENEDNPLRCPVKLYEFYLSKCPESVKTRNDVFYLLPERSCVPDSPVWYSTMALGKEALEKMLHRVKMVKEINVALLTS